MLVTGDPNAPATLPQGNSPQYPWIGGELVPDPVWMFRKIDNSLASARIWTPYGPACSIVTVLTLLIWLFHILQILNIVEMEPVCLCSFLLNKKYHTSHIDIVLRLFFYLLVLTVKRHKRVLGMGQEGPGDVCVWLKLQCQRAQQNKWHKRGYRATKSKVEMVREWEHKLFVRKLWATLTSLRRNRLLKQSFRGIVMQLKISA
jgi:hypothetical protein